MKLMRMGILPIIAIVAIALTAATKADVMDLKKKVVFTCDPLNTNHFWKGELKNLTTGAVNLYRNPSAPSPGITTCPGQIDFCVKVSTLVVPSEEVICNEQAQQFCCIEILPDNQTLPCGTVSGGQDFTQYTKKARIYCKSSN